MIPVQHREFISKASDLLKQDGRIAGLALGGSYIKGEMDEYSDLDFVVAAYPDKLDEIMAERVRIAEGLGKLLSCFTGEHIGVPSVLICLFDLPLLHVDFNFVTPAQAVRRLYDPVVLFERDGALSSVISTSEPLKPPSRHQWYEDRFWVWVHYIAAKLGRGELFDALDSIDYIRENVLGPMIQAEKGIWPRGCRFIERDAPEYLPKLIETVALYEKTSCLRALKAEIALYRALRRKHEDQLVRRPSAEERAVEYLGEIEKRV